MGFSVFVEAINLRIRKTTHPVQLHEPYTEDPQPPQQALLKRRAAIRASYVVNSGGSHE